jgi:hypothetical protein
MPQTATARLLDAFEAAIPAAAERGAAAICREIPAYRRIADAALVGDIRATMTENFTNHGPDGHPEGAALHGRGERRRHR